MESKEAEEGKRQNKKFEEKIRVSATFSLKHDVAEAKKLVGSVKEDFANLSSSLTVAQKPSAEKIYEKIQEIDKRLASIDERTKTIEGQTRPQTLLQKLRAEIFSGLVGWIIAFILGIILIILGLRGI